MPPIELPVLSADELAALDDLYHSTRDARLRMRVHIVLLAAEQRFVAPQIAAIVRADEETLGYRKGATACVVICRVGRRSLAFPADRYDHGRACGPMHPLPCRQRGPGSSDDDRSYHNARADGVSRNITSVLQPRACPARI